jgi:serine/threonine protein phosphatase PrpC
MRPTSVTMTHPSETSAPADRKPRDDEIDVYGLTHPGLVRQENQDHFLICSLHKSVAIHGSSLPDFTSVSSAGSDRVAFLAMVADGVGGGSRGEEASRLAVELATQYVTGCMRAYYAADPADIEFVDALQQAATGAHEEFLRLAEADPDRAGMATTLTLWLGSWPRAYLLQVGDSRYYLYRDGELTQLSRDQTMAQELVDLGVLSRADAARSRYATTLSSAIGGRQNAPVVARIPHAWGYVHLLCSDGLTRHVSDDRIRERIAGMSSARELCEGLLQDALDGGGTDNITIIAGRCIPKDPA